MTKQQKIDELKKLLRSVLVQLDLHNSEYKHITSKEFIEEIKKALEQ